MSIEALTSAEISLPARPDAGLVRSRIAILAKHVDLVGLTDNHAGQPRMSPLAAVALARGCVVDPFAVDAESELALLGRKIAAGADFAQTQMVLEPGRLASFLERAAEAGKLGDCRIHASVPVIRTRKLADILDRVLPFELPRRAYSRIASGGGIDMAIETAIALAELPQVDALHVMAWGSEDAAGKVAAAFRAARGAPVERSAAGTG